MKSTEEKILQLPEVLEFLKLSRTMNRQLKLFSNVQMDDKDLEVIKKITNKVKNNIDNFLNKLEGGQA